MKPLTSAYVICLLVLAALSCSSAEGLVAYYPFDVDAQDSSSYSNHGTIVGATIVPGGVSGGACEFDGIDDYVSIAHTESLFSDKFTVSAWVKSRDPNALMDRAICGKHREHDNISYHWIYQRGAELWSTMIGGSYGKFCDVTTGVSSVFNQWGMIALTYDGGAMSMYVNGNLVGTSVLAGYRGNTYDYLIGAGEWNSTGTGPQRWWDGWIDEFRLYDRALSYEEILALYNGESNSTAVAGALKCELGPEGALDAGAGWRLSTESAEVWHPSGYVIENLASGTYEVNFRSLPGWLRPENQYAVIAEGTNVVSAAYEKVPDDSLVLYYDFDSPVSAYIADLSGCNNSGLVVGATYSPSGYSGGSFEFNGASAYIRVPNNESLMSTQFTVVAWAKTRDAEVVADRAICGKHRAGDNLSYYWLYQRQNQMWGTMIGSHYNYFQDVVSSISPFYNQWGLVALTYDGSTLFQYVNGVLTDHQAVSGYSGNAYDLLIGAGEWQYSGGSPQRWWNGWIDEFRIYNRALTAEEIYTIHQIGGMTGTYSYGSVSCTLTPQGVVDANGHWRLNTESPETGHASGFVLSNVLVGAYSIVFEDVLGWVPPSSIPLEVRAGQQTNVVGIYSHASTNKLVLYYPCDQTPSGSVIDYSGYGNHGMACNVVYDPVGQSNGCYYFNGTNAYIVAPDDDSYDILQFSITAWARSADTNVEQVVIKDRAIIGKHRESYNSSYYWIHQRTNYLWSTMEGISTDFRYLMTPAEPIIEQWGLVTLTYDGTNNCLYVNGELKDVNNCPDYRGNEYNLLVGAGEWKHDMSGAQRLWHGWLDEVKIYSYAMSSNEVAILYQGEARIDVIAPEILNIVPPNRHVTTLASVNMNIFVSDNIGVAGVSVNGNPADKIGADIWHYHQDALDEYSNAFNVVVTDLFGNTAEQQVHYFRGSKLKLRAVSDGKWQVHNVNSIDIDYTWGVLDQSETGERTVLAHDKDDFDTSVGPKTVCIYVDGIMQDMKAWNPSPKIGANQEIEPKTSTLKDAARPTLDLRWESVSGQVYTVETAYEVTGLWTQVPGICITGNSSFVTVTNALSGDAGCYRIAVDNVLTNGF